METTSHNLGINGLSLPYRRELLDLGKSTGLAFVFQRRSTSYPSGLFCSVGSSVTGVRPYLGLLHEDYNFLKAFWRKKGYSESGRIGLTVEASRTVKYLSKKKKWKKVIHILLKYDHSIIKNRCTCLENTSVMHSLSYCLEKLNICLLLGAR